MGWVSKKVLFGHLDCLNLHLICNFNFMLAIWMYMLVIHILYENKSRIFSYTIKNHQFLGHINVRPIFVPQLIGRYIFINQSQKGFTGNLFGFYWKNTVSYRKKNISYWKKITWIYFQFTGRNVIFYRTVYS